MDQKPNENFNLIRDFFRLIFCGFMTCVIGVLFVLGHIAGGILVLLTVVFYRLGLMR